jgi:hypothetical protein
MLRLLACVVALCVGSASAFVPAAASMRVAQPQQHSAAAAVSMMAKAPTKPMRVNNRNREYNKHYRSEMRTLIKKVSNPSTRRRRSPWVSLARCSP